MSGPEARDRRAIERALAGALARHGERPAVAGGGRTWSYAELRRRIDEAARGFDEALPDGGHVGFRLGNRPEYVSLYFGALEAGRLPLLLDASFNRGEVEAIRADCGLDALVGERNRIDALDLPGRAEPIGTGGPSGDPSGDPVVIVPLERPAPPLHAPRASTRVCRFTSGTTGRPKCIEFRGEAVVAAAENWVAGTGMTARDRTLCLAALSNGLAFNTSLLSTFLAGGELHFLSGLPLTRPVARTVAGAGITRLVAFPTLYRNFTLPNGEGDGFSDADLSTLEHAISAGAPLPPQVREAFRDRFRLDISDYYGIAETGPCTFERDPSHHTGLGQPLPGVELRIDADGDEDDETPGIHALPDEAEGEVLVRTASMASGYLNQPGLFESRLTGDGFYRSGDRGFLRDGRLHLVGRNAGHINVAGRKVDPVEVAGVVRDLDGVADAVAFPDEDLNRETVVHLVVAGRSGGAPERAAVLAACRDRLAHYKVPGLVSFVDEIPRNGIGKPRIGLLRERLAVGGPDRRREEVSA